MVQYVCAAAGSAGADDARLAIENGMAIVHINTEIRVAFKKGLQEGLAAMPDEVAPYKYLAQSVKEVEAVVSARLKLFNMMQ